MKRLLTLAPLLILLTGCAAATPIESLTATTAPTSAPSATAGSSSLPACESFIGKPADSVFVVDHGPQCITGTGEDSDSTGYSVTNCDPVGNESTPVYAWVSSDVTAPDGREYAAKEGGVVVVVPGASPSSPAIIANILLAVGC